MGPKFGEDLKRCRKEAAEDDLHDAEDERSGAVIAEQQAAQTMGNVTDEDEMAMHSQPMSANDTLNEAPQHSTALLQIYLPGSAAFGLRGAPSRGSRFFAS